MIIMIKALQWFEPCGQMPDWWWFWSTDLLPDVSSTVAHFVPLYTVSELSSQLSMVYGLCLWKYGWELCVNKYMVDYYVALVYDTEECVVGMAVHQSIVCDFTAVADGV